MEERFWKSYDKKFCCVSNATHHVLRNSHSSRRLQTHRKRKASCRRVTVEEVTGKLFFFHVYIKSVCWCQWLIRDSFSNFHDPKRWVLCVAVVSVLFSLHEMSGNIFVSFCTNFSWDTTVFQEERFLFFVLNLYKMTELRSMRKGVRTAYQSLLWSLWWLHALLLIIMTHVLLPSFSSWFTSILYSNFWIDVIIIIFMTGLSVTLFRITTTLVNVSSTLVVSQAMSPFESMNCHPKKSKLFFASLSVDDHVFHKRCLCRTNFDDERNKSH